MSKSLLRHGTIAPTVSLAIRMIHLSQSAADEVMRLKSRQKSPQVYFRVGVAAIGCSGLSYITKFEEVAQVDDQIHDCQGIRVAINPQSLPYVNGLTLDYSEDLMGGSFRFHNPNASQHCGCGTSFSVVER
ncbi:HesB/IscA family protein [Phormidesmis sp. 146-33]